jgi:hypothetical protein
MSIGTIEVTDANQSVTASDAYDELVSTMQEVRTHIETARTLVQSAIRDIDDGALLSALSALVIANSHHWFALSAWEPDPH